MKGQLLSLSQNTISATPDALTEEDPFSLSHLIGKLELEFFDQTSGMYRRGKLVWINTESRNHLFATRTGRLLASKTPEELEMGLREKTIRTPASTDVDHELQKRGFKNNALNTWLGRVIPALNFSY